MELWFLPPGWTGIRFIGLLSRLLFTGNLCERSNLHHNHHHNKKPTPLIVYMPKRFTQFPTETKWTHAHERKKSFYFPLIFGWRALVGSCLPMAGRPSDACRYNSNEMTMTIIWWASLLTTYKLALASASHLPSSSMFLAIRVRPSSVMRISQPIKSDTKTSLPIFIVICFILSPFETKDPL